MDAPPPPEAFFSREQLALTRAIADANLALVDELAATTDLASPGAEGVTVLAYALLRASHDPSVLPAVTSLVRAGADALDQNIVGAGTAIDLACAAPTPDLLVAILDGGVSPNAKVRGSTPILFRAAHERSPGNITALVARGADVNARDSLGTPAITYALRAMQLDQVEELLARGADPRAVNLLGESFMHVLHTVMERQLPESPARATLSNIASRYLWEGAAWPPDSPAVERERLREKGVEPIVPVGASR